MIDAIDPLARQNKVTTVEKNEYRPHIYVDLLNRDIGSYVADAQQAVAHCLSAMFFATNAQFDESTTSPERDVPFIGPNRRRQPCLFRRG